MHETEVADIRDELTVDELTMMTVKKFVHARENPITRTIESGLTLSVGSGITA